VSFDETDIKNVLTVMPPYHLSTPSSLHYAKISGIADRIWLLIIVGGCLSGVKVANTEVCHVVHTADDRQEPAGADGHQQAQEDEPPA